MGLSPGGSIKEGEGTITQEILALGLCRSRRRDKNFTQGSLENLPETFSHSFLQKAKGYVDGFIKRVEGQNSS